MDANVEVLRLFAIGAEEGAEILRQQIVNEAELADARERGLDVGKLLEVQEEEANARTQRKIDLAVEEERIEEERNANFATSIENRKIALGLDGDELAIFNKRIEQQREYDAAVKAGFPPELLDDLAALHDSELANFVADLAEKAIEAAEQIAAATAKLAASFQKDLDQRFRDLNLSGGDLVIANLQAMQDEELAAAQALLDAGTITQEMFNMLVDIQTGEMLDATNGIIEAEKELAAVREKSRLSAIDDLEIQEMLLAGDIRGAKIRRFEIKQKEDLDAFVAKLGEGEGTQGFIDRFMDVQAQNFINFVASLVDKEKDQGKADKAILTGGDLGAGGDPTRGFTAINQGQATLLIGMGRERNSLLRDIEMNTRFGVTSPNFSAPITGGGGAINVEVHINGPVSGGNAIQIGQDVGNEALGIINAGLGAVRNDDATLSGDLLGQGSRT